MDREAGSKSIDRGTMRKTSAYTYLDGAGGLEKFDTGFIPFVALEAKLLRIVDWRIS